MKLNIVFPTTRFVGQMNKAWPRNSISFFLHWALFMSMLHVAGYTAHQCHVNDRLPWVSRMGKGMWGKGMCGRKTWSQGATPAWWVEAKDSSDSWCDWQLLGVQRGRAQHAHCTYVHVASNGTRTNWENVQHLLLRQLLQWLAPGAAPGCLLGGGGGGKMSRYCCASRKFLRQPWKSRSAPGTPTHFFSDFKKISKHFSEWDRGIIMGMTDRWADKQKKKSKIIIKKNKNKNKIKNQKSWGGAPLPPLAPPLISTNTKQIPIISNPTPYCGCPAPNQKTQSLPSFSLFYQRYHRRSNGRWRKCWITNRDAGKDFAYPLHFAL